jgi:hypothetical protein
VKQIFNLCLEQLTKKSKVNDFNEGIPFNFKKNFKILQQVNQDDKIIEIQNENKLIKKIQEIHSHLENVFGKFQNKSSFRVKKKISHQEFLVH